jgi:hypothetical protein
MLNSRTIGKPSCSERVEKLALPLIPSILLSSPGRPKERERRMNIFTRLPIVTSKVMTK